jgi:hypothetical protein
MKVEIMITVSAEEIESKQKYLEKIVGVKSPTEEDALDSIYEDVITNSGSVPPIVKFRIKYEG